MAGRPRRARQCGDRPGWGCPKSAGRGRLEIGTYGDISTTKTGAGTVRAEARFRDWDGEVRKVTAVGPTAVAAKVALREKLARRSIATGFGAPLSPESTVAQLAAAWLEDVGLRADLAQGTKDRYEREVNSLSLALRACDIDDSRRAEGLPPPG